LETGDVVFTIVRVRARRIRHGAILEVPGNRIFLVFAIVENTIFGAYLFKFAGNQILAVARGIVTAAAPKDSEQT
jgi:hypothetical protein